MSKEDEPSLQARFDADMAEQTVGEELLWDAERPLAGDMEAIDTMHRRASVAGICASVEPGKWLLRAHFDDDKFDGERGVPCHIITRHQNPETLRELLRARGYVLTSGAVNEEKHCGAELWKRDTSVGTTTKGEL